MIRKNPNATCSAARDLLTVVQCLFIILSFACLNHQISGGSFGYFLSNVIKNGA